jgi:Htaa
MTPLRRRARGLGAAAAFTAVAATGAIAAPTAGAAATRTSGTTTIQLKGVAAKALRGQQVALSAKLPAKAGAKRIVLPVAAGTVAKRATLSHQGSIAFKRRTGGRTRTVTLTGLQTRLAAGGSTVTAKLGAKRIALFTLTAPRQRLKLAATGATLTGATVRLSPAAAKALKAKLALRRLPAGQLGTAAVSAKVSGGTGGGTPTPGGGGTTTPGGGGPVPGGPVVGPITNEPPVLTRAAGAIDVTSARLTWWVRDSWIAYLYGGNMPASGVTVSDGATAQAPILAAQHICQDAPDRNVPVLSYAFDFPFANGWATPAGDVAGLYFNGRIGFQYRTHGIDVTATNPEVELNGRASRLIFRLGGGANTRLGDKRGVLTSLDLARATRTVSPDGKTFSYTARGFLGPESADTFAGFYVEGSGYGCVQVSFTTP